jgi:hypothetical protein
MNLEPHFDPGIVKSTKIADDALTFGLLAFVLRRTHT